MATLSEETLARAQCPRNIVIGAVDAGDTRPGEHRDREPGGERNQENAGAEAGREDEKGEGQPSRCRQRPDEPQNRVNPITGEARPSDRHAGNESGRRAEKITCRQQTKGREDACA